MSSEQHQRFLSRTLTSLRMTCRKVIHPKKHFHLRFPALAAGTFTSFTGNSYPVGGTVDALTVGGFPVAVAGGGAGATITYTIGGVLD